MKHYLDEDTIPGRSHLTEEQWADTALCSDTEIEKVILEANSQFQKEQQKTEDGESRLMWSQGLARPIPRSERSVQVKIARKIHASQRQKSYLDGLCEVVSPGSTVGKISPTTSIIKKPNRPEVRVRIYDIAKFGTRNERYTELGQYFERCPKKTHEKTFEHKITNHRKDLVGKNLGSKKIKRNKRQLDDISVISSGRFCISTSSNVARALRKRIPKRNPKHDDSFINRPDVNQILHFSSTVPLAAPTTQPITAGPSAPQVTSSEQLTPILRKEKRTITASDTSDSDTSSLKRSKRLLKKQKSQQYRYQS